VTSSRTRGKAFARLYEKYGFEHEGLHRRGRIIDGHVEDVIIMGLLLGP
jgi:RimJ/RimL family protein N-acetyltransferase